MKIDVKVKLDNSKIRQLVDAVELSEKQAAHITLSQIVSDAIVPKDTGELERSGFVRRKSKSRYQIVYDTPYARRLFWHPEYNFRTDKNQNAQGRWLEVYVSGERKGFFNNAFIKCLKRNTRGVIKWN